MKENLIPDVIYSVTSNGNEVTGDTDFNCTFRVDMSAPRYTLQVGYSGLTGSGTINLYQSVDGSNYEAVLDDSGSAISQSVTGSDSLVVINNSPGYGIIKVSYVAGLVTDGSVWVILDRGV